MGSPTNTAEFLQKLVDNKFDPELGKQVKAYLIERGLEIDRPDYSPAAAEHHLELGVKDAFKALGINPDDPSTRDTPSRFACMVVGELTRGLCYDMFPKCTATPNGVKAHVVPPGGDPKFDRFTGIIGAYNQMVLVKGIQSISLCEHHLQTIDGVVHVAYIPKDKVLGLSKFARVVDFFSRRPQIQERMTDQIYYALEYILETKDIAVVVDAVHYCMKARGAMQHSARTQTDKMGGKFFTEQSLRQELFNAIRS
jgi:GTP cyclohydrolase I